MISRARSLYARLLKAQRKAFSGDWIVINAARDETRSKFIVNRDLADGEVLEKKLKEGQEICELIEHNVIQGQRVGSPDGGQGPYFRLKFRPEIEINDGYMKGKPGRCC